MKKPASEINLNETLKKLASIVSWFESQSELDVEKGLEYVKDGAQLIRAIDAYLKNPAQDRPNRQQTIKKMITTIDGTAGRQVLDLIIGLAQ